MRSRLAEHFREKRREAGLGYGDLARQVGYQNVTKGANRIQTFEQRGVVHAELQWKLADVLDIDEAIIDRLIDEDRREFRRRWEEWADQPIRPSLYVRLVRKVYKREELPAEVDFEQAKRCAAETARSRGKEVHLQWSRRLTVVFNKYGLAVSQYNRMPKEDAWPMQWLTGRTRKRRKRPCPSCRGSGKYVGLNLVESCGNCGGSGSVPNAG